MDIGSDVTENDSLDESSVPYHTAQHAADTHACTHAHAHACTSEGATHTHTTSICIQVGDTSQHVCMCMCMCMTHLLGGTGTAHVWRARIVSAVSKHEMHASCAHACTCLLRWADDSCALVKPTHIKTHTTRHSHSIITLASHHTSNMSKFEMTDEVRRMHGTCMGDACGMSCYGMMCVRGSSC